MSNENNNQNQQITSRAVRDGILKAVGVIVLVVIALDIWSTVINHVTDDDGGQARIFADRTKANLEEYKRSLQAAQDYEKQHPSTLPSVSVVPDSEPGDSNTIQPTSKTDSSNVFKFPQDTCGDTSANGASTWYPVFIDKGNLAYVRNNYCRDAVSAVRENTGVATVQVASFTDYQRAVEFAKAVNGEVGQAK